MTASTPVPVPQAPLPAAYPSPGDPSLDSLSPEVRRVLADPAFAELRSRRNRLALGLTVAMMLVYYGFVLMVAFAPKTLATPVSGVISLGIVLGLGVILVAIVLTGVYVNRANATFDQLTRRVGGAV